MALPDRSEAGFLAGPFAVSGARTVILADTGEGKTTFALQLCRAILTGENFLGWTGTCAGPVLVVDLEQGLRSAKRSLRDAALADREDLIYLRVPDGLALDRDEREFAQLENAINRHRPVAVVLDPFYKAHASDDPNAERPIVELMRRLDALRDRYGMALILPAHPRKLSGEAATRARKLTIHDVAGSGAIVRGAETVLGLERVGHGYARLRFLKDRDGDLPVGTAWSLIFDRAAGFRRDPSDLEPERDLAAELLALEDREWHTLKEWSGVLKARESATREALERLVGTAAFEYAEGPEGRHKTARCWRQQGAPNPTAHLGARLVDRARESGSA
jgi:hypothetical protein